jgi:hypothetical protein
VGFGRIMERPGGFVIGDGDGGEGGC